MERDDENMAKKPFENYTLEGEGKKRDRFMVELSPDQRVQLDRFKDAANTDQDPVAIKILAFSNILNANKVTLTLDNLRYLVKKERRRARNFE